MLVALWFTGCGDGSGPLEITQLKVAERPHSRFCGPITVQLQVTSAAGAQVTALGVKAKTNKAGNALLSVDAVAVRKAGNNIPVTVSKSGKSVEKTLAYKPPKPLFVMAGRYGGENAQGLALVRFRGCGIAKAATELGTVRNLSPKGFDVVIDGVMLLANQKPHSNYQLLPVKSPHVTVRVTVTNESGQTAKRTAKVRIGGGAKVAGEQHGIEKMEARISKVAKTPLAFAAPFAGAPHIRLSKCETKARCGTNTCSGTSCARSNSLPLRT